MPSRNTWQKRVEIIEARKKESKQRKQKCEEKRAYKTWMQGFLATLDRHQDTLRKHFCSGPCVLQIWSTALPSDAPPLLDLFADEESGRTPHHSVYNSSLNRRRARSISIEHQEAVILPSARKGRDRSNSLNDKSSGRRKSHPRSRDSIGSPLNTDQPPVADIPALCRPHFFSGKCEDLGCPNWHFSKGQKTLASVLGSKPGSDLAAAEAAVVEQIPKAVEMINPGTMEIMYNSSVSVDFTSQEYGMSEVIAETLMKNDILLTNVVYVVLNDVLVFDRYREGEILSERKFLMETVGEGSLGRSRRSLGSEDDSDDENFLFNLPGSILEHLLTYLPDASVATASQVCKGWYHEIGKNPSPNLWLHLLERRRWPVPPISSLQIHEGKSLDLALQSISYRTAFLHHYAVLRDTSALKAAVDAIGRRQSAEESEMCFQDFSKRKHAPPRPNYCVAVKVWSVNRILVAYSPECSLRLFESVNLLENSEKRCKELAYQCIDPCRKTKRRSCSLVAMDLDEDFIGCLCYVMADGIDAEASLLVLTSRDEFLFCESSAAAFHKDDSNFHVVDIGEAVLNYLLSLGDVDYRLLQLMDHLADNDNPRDIEVLASQSMVACGHGRFMVEVSIYIPVDEWDANGEGTMPFDRKLVLFSAGVGAIVWMGDSTPLNQQPRPRDEEMILHCYRPPGSRSACTLAVASPSSRSIVVTEIEARGDVQAPVLVPESLIAPFDVVQSGWRFEQCSYRAIAMTNAFIVAADSVEQIGQNGHVMDYQSIISFYPRYPTSENKGITGTLTLHGKLKVTSFVAVRDEHLIAICIGGTRDIEEVVTPAEVAIPPQDFGGHWERRNIAVLVSIHVPSRTELCRTTLAIGAHLQYQPPIIACLGETIGLGLSYAGVVMTGNAVRGLASKVAIVLDEPGTATKKKKRSSARKKSAKKDRYARGITMRG